MPYDINRQDEDELKRQAAATAGAAQNPGSFSLAPGPSPQAPNSAAPAQPSALGAAPVSRFVNFGRRFELNKGSAEQMARGVGNKVEAQGGEVSAGIDAAKNKFMTDAKAGETTYSDPGLALPDKYKPLTQPGEAGYGVGVHRSEDAGTNRPPAAPGAITREEVARRAGATYSGPTSMDAAAGYADMLGAAKKAGADATALGTNGGVQAALGYTGSSGNSRLDSALTGVAGADQFGSLAKRFGGLGDKLSGMNADSKRVAAGYAQNTSEAARKYADYGSQFDAESAARLKPTEPIVTGAAGDVAGTYAANMNYGGGTSPSIEWGKKLDAWGEGVKGSEGVPGPNNAERDQLKKLLVDGHGVDGSPYPNNVGTGPDSSAAAVSKWLQHQLELIRQRGGK